MSDASSVQALQHRLQQLEAENLSLRRRLDAAAPEAIEARHRLLAETMLQGVVHQDAAGTIISMNPAAERILGKTREQFLGSDSAREERDTIRQDGSRFPGVDHPSMVALRTGETVRGEVMGVWNPREARYRWIRIDAVPVRASGDAAPREVYAVFEDITEALRAAEEVAHARDAAEAASAAKDRFLATLSHELRAPLAPVRLLLSFWDQRATLPEEVRREVAMIRRNIDLECRLIDDMLDLNRVARGKLDLQLARFDLHREVRHAIEGVQAEADAKQLTLRFEAGAARAEVLADAGRVQQVLWNLLRNAVKFTPPRGEVTVRTSVTPDGNIRTEVRDTGVGIDPALLPHVFNAFEQGGADVTRQFGGLGLGLTIGKAITDLLGGRLTAHSEGRGKGATFTVDLPLAAPEVRDAAGDDVASCDAPVTSSEPLRVLLVEDDEDTAHVMSYLLRSFGHDVQSAGTVAGALAASAARQFDLIISDLGLPDGGGDELMQQVMARQPIRAIALSGYGMEEDIRRSRAAGFAAHLTKPVNLELLALTIEHVAGRRSTTPTRGA